MTLLLGTVTYAALVDHHLDTALWTLLSLLLDHMEDLLLVMDVLFGSHLLRLFDLVDDPLPSSDVEDLTIGLYWATRTRTWFRSVTTPRTTLNTTAHRLHTRTDGSPCTTPPTTPSPYWAVA